MSKKEKGFLSIEEADAVADLVTHAGWRPLQKLVERLTRDQEESVLKLRIGDSEREVIYAKLRAEGARKLAHDIESLKEKFQGPRDEP